MRTVTAPSRAYGNEGFSGDEPYGKQHFSGEDGPQPRRARPEAANVESAYQGRDAYRDSEGLRSRRDSDSRLNPKYTFETFVIGSSNRFAHAAAIAVAENPGKSYNPLTIYGESGLGKTHLLHALGHYVRELFRSGSGSLCLDRGTDQRLHQRDQPETGERISGADIATSTCC